MEFWWRVLLADVPPELDDMTDLVIDVAGGGDGGGTGIKMETGSERPSSVITSADITSHLQRMPIWHNVSSTYWLLLIKELMKTDKWQAMTIGG